MHTAVVKMVFKDKELKLLMEGDKVNYGNFILSLKEGDIVDCYLTHITDQSEKTLGQLAKVHAAIRELADKSGHGFNEIKDIVKNNAGLVTYTSSSIKTLKSFRDCNKEELSSAIQACIEIGKVIGCDLY